MNKKYISEASILGILLCIGLIGLGYFISKAAFLVKSADRIVTVKGLAEREVPANIAIWPISFKETDNDLLNLYSKMKVKSDKITKFLKENSFSDNEISIAPPQIKDLEADQYFNSNRVKFRYLGKTTITIHTKNVETVRKSITKLSELVKSGIALSSDYEDRTQYLFTNLNEIKPDMIEIATKNARQAAEKFAQDSGSNLGKIRRAWQGQFSIKDRDSNTPYLKKVRVVTTLEYFLADN